MINRLYKAAAVLAFASCMGFAGCNAGALTNDINDLTQSTIVDLGTLFLQSAVDNSFSNTN